MCPARGTLLNYQCGLCWASKSASWAARTLASRFAAAFGKSFDSPLAEIDDRFPAPENIAARDASELTALGILPETRANDSRARSCARFGRTHASRPPPTPPRQLKQCNLSRASALGRRTILRCARCRGLMPFRTPTWA